MAKAEVHAWHQLATVTWLELALLNPFSVEPIDAQNKVCSDPSGHGSATWIKLNQLDHDLWPFILEQNIGVQLPIIIQGRFSVHQLQENVATSSSCAKVSCAVWPETSRNLYLIWFTSHKWVFNGMIAGPLLQLSHGMLVIALHAMSL